MSGGRTVVTRDFGKSRTSNNIDWVFITFDQPGLRAVTLEKGSQYLTRIEWNGLPKRHKCGIASQIPGLALDFRVKKNCYMQKLIIRPDLTNL